jgi:hypothetical protein
MPTAENIDYPAELFRIAAAAMSRRNPGDVISAMDAIVLREVATWLRANGHLGPRPESSPPSGRPPTG